MLPVVFTVLVLYSCFLTNGSCELYDELKELKTKFDINLYQRLAEPQNRTNLIVAPASVSISLGLLQFGAQGNTLMQLENALGYNIHGNVHFDKLFFSNNCFALYHKFTLQLPYGESNCTMELNF